MAEQKNSISFFFFAMGLALICFILSFMGFTKTSGQKIYEYPNLMGPAVSQDGRGSLFPGGGFKDAGAFHAGKELSSNPRLVSPFGALACTSEHVDDLSDCILQSSIVQDEPKLSESAELGMAIKSFTGDQSSTDNLILALTGCLQSSEMSSNKSIPACEVQSIVQAVQSAERVFKDTTGIDRDREAVTRWLVGLGGLEDMAVRVGFELPATPESPTSGAEGLVSTPQRQPAIIRLKLHLERIENPRPHEAAMLSSIKLSLTS